jgi:NADH dehydrogenase
MPEVGPKMGLYTVERLLDAGIEVFLDTRVKTMEGGHVVLDDGTEFDTDTIVWTAGVKPNPMLERTDLPRDARGRVECTAELQVVGMPDVFSAGDCASVPDLSKDDPEAKTSPSAQHAVRQAKVLADNIVAYLRGRQLTKYKHAYAGSVASLGLYKGVAEIYGIKLRGIIAWLMHRTYHVSRMPTWNRRIRIVVDWTGALLLGREVVALGQINDPRAEFNRVANPTPLAQPAQRPGPEQQGPPAGRAQGEEAKAVTSGLRGP